MYLIKTDELQKWEKNSIETAKSIGLLDDEILDILENSIVLKLNLDERPSGIWYGQAYFVEPKEESFIEVFERNPAGYLPSGLREILNQSGMDHELIGHIGHYLSGKPYGEKNACVAQERMAKKRGEKSIGWKSASKFIPLVQKYHRNVDFSSYKQSL